MTAANMLRSRVARVTASVYPVAKTGVSLSRVKTLLRPLELEAYLTLLDARIAIRRLPRD